MECKTLLELKQQELNKEVLQKNLYKEKFQLSLQAQTELQKNILDSENLNKVLIKEVKRTKRKTIFLKVGLFAVSGVAVFELVKILIH